MRKVIMFEEEEFKQKLIEFCNNFIETSEKGWGVKLISNEDGKILEDRNSIIGIFMLPWNDTFNI